MKLHKGDNIKMMAGKDRGKTGKVLYIFPEANKAVIEGLNLVKKHERAKKQGQKGQIVSVPRPVDISGVMLICKSCGKAARTGIKVLENGKKARICKKCGAEN